MTADSMDKISDYAAIRAWVFKRRWAYIAIQAAIAACWGAIFIGSLLRNIDQSPSPGKTFIVWINIIGLMGMAAVLTFNLTFGWSNRAKSSE